MFLSTFWPFIWHTPFAFTASFAGSTGDFLFPCNAILTALWVWLLRTQSPGYLKCLFLLLLNWANESTCKRSTDRKRASSGCLLLLFFPTTVLALVYPSVNTASLKWSILCSYNLEAGSNHITVFRPCNDVAFLLLLASSFKNIFKNPSLREFELVSS